MLTEAIHDLHRDENPMTNPITERAQGRGTTRRGTHGYLSALGAILGATFLFGCQHDYSTGVCHPVASCTPTCTPDADCVNGPCTDGHCLGPVCYTTADCTSSQRCGLQGDLLFDSGIGMCIDVSDGGTNGG